MIAPLVQAKKETGVECDYHKALRYHVPYKLSYFISPLLTVFLATNGNIGIKKKFGLFLIGRAIEAIIRKIIQLRLENKVASGELNP